MKKSTEDYLSGALLAIMVIALLVSANHLFGEELPIETDSAEWVKDGVLEKRVIKLPPEKEQPLRINWELAS